MNFCCGKKEIRMGLGEALVWYFMRQLAWNCQCSSCPRIFKLLQSKLIENVWFHSHSRQFIISLGIRRNKWDSRWIHNTSKDQNFIQYQTQNFQTSIFKQTTTKVTARFFKKSQDSCLNTRKHFFVIVSSKKQ